MKKYVFKPYSNSFPKLFEKEKQRLTSHIKDVLIEHVGSTAVPNLGGKGIIDIAIAVNKEKLKSVSEQLQKLGYEFRLSAGTSERLFFRINLHDEEEGTRIYHIHLTYLNSKDWEEMIEFRDYLRSNPEEAKQYAEIKKKAAEKAHEDREKYIKLKEPTINGILTKLLQEKRFS